MMHSPLRYPGGKSDFLGVARTIFETGGFVGLPVIEPYAGSAAVSLGLLDFGLTPHVTLLERDPLLYSFWKALFTRTDEFITAFQDLEISINTWNRLRPLLALQEPNERALLECGVAALFFNRCNFSGILGAGPIGGQAQIAEHRIDCRTKKDEIIPRVLALAMLADKVTVLFGDAVELVREHARKRDVFFYLDPPYFNKGDLLYRHFYRLKQHKELASALRDAEFNWLLSYDEHHVIEFLYEEFNIARLDCRYSARSPKQRRELLISNFPLASEHGACVQIARRARAWPSNLGEDRIQISTAP